MTREQDAIVLVWLLTSDNEDTRAMRAHVVEMLREFAPDVAILGAAAAPRAQRVLELLSAWTAGVSGAACGGARNMR